MPEPLVGLYRLTLTGTMHGSIIENVWHFKDRDTNPLGSYYESLAQLMNDFNSVVLEKYLDFMSYEYKALQIMGVVLYPLPGPEILAFYSETFGQQNASSLPSHDACVVSWRTGYAGKSQRGRTYIPAIPKQDVTLSEIQEPTLGRIVLFTNTMLGLWSLGGTSTRHVFGVFSQKHGITRVLLPAPHLVYNSQYLAPVQNCLVRPSVATMRKRKKGIGN
jgi:hypothetical protein